MTDRHDVERSDWVTFLSDYGLDDHLVGVCKGVIARIAPHVRIIDVCHQVRPQDVTMGGEMLAEAWPYLPTGVHLALVDPFTADARPRRRRAAAGTARSSSRRTTGSPPGPGRSPAASPRRTSWPSRGCGPDARRAASAAATCSRRSPRTWPAASRWPRSVRRLDPDVAGQRPDQRAARCTATTCTARSGWSTTSATWRSTCAAATWRRPGSSSATWSSCAAAAGPPRCRSRSASARCRAGAPWSARTRSGRSRSRSTAAAPTARCGPARGEAVVLGRVHRHLGQAATKVSVVDGPPS